MFPVLFPAKKKSAEPVRTKKLKIRNAVDKAPLEVQKWFRRIPGPRPFAAKGMQGAAAKALLPPSAATELSSGA